MLTVGLGEPPASITGIKGLVLEHFGVADRPGGVTPSEPDWIERQLRRRGIDDERVLAAMARVPRELLRPRGAPRGSPTRTARCRCRTARRSRSRSWSRSSARRSACDGGERVLDVGTGSGYAAAVLAELAAEVHTIERIPELAEAARAALAAAGYERVARARRRRLARAAGARSVRRRSRSRPRRRACPPALWEQLGEGGRIALPLGPAAATSSSASSSGRRTGRSCSPPCPARFVPLVDRLDRVRRARAEESPC